MTSRYSCSALKITIISFFISGCQISNLELLQSNALPSAWLEKASKFKTSREKAEADNSITKPLNEIIDGALADQNNGTDFLTVLGSALDRDPSLISQRRLVAARLAAIETVEARKNYQVTSTLYGGIEDITDDTKGIALGVNASRLIFDGGLIDAQILAKTYEAEAAKLDLQATIDQRAYRLGEIWLELEKYDSLKRLIDARLAVLDPLISQLEEIAKAGIGDVSKVAAAQRTVSGIRVMQTNVSEGLAKARLEYINAFGLVPSDVFYDSNFVEDLLPEELGDDLVQKSSLLRAKYAVYKAAIAKLDARRAQSEFNIGFEARAMRPFAGSGYDSDESIGLVARKTLYNGGVFESEISEAQALAESALAEVRSAFREGSRAVNSAQQTIESMDKAISLAKENARVMADEIAYLRQQLIIGGSTLDSVLSAEARLYEVEAKEIHFLADKRKAELQIVSAFGLLVPSLTSNQ